MAELYERLQYVMYNDQPTQNSKSQSTCLPNSILTLNECPWYESSTTLRQGRSPIECFKLSSLQTHFVDELAIFGDCEHIQLTSSGCAVHSDPTKACHNAAMELLERDILLRKWFKRIPPFVVKDFSTKWSPIAEEAAQKFNFKLDIFVYPPEATNPPVAIASLRNKKNQYPYWFFGTGCGLSWLEAIDGAIRECLAGWTFNFFAGRSERLNMIDGADQPFIYYDPNNAPKIAHYFSSNSAYNLKSDLTKPEIDVQAILEGDDFSFLSMHVGSEPCCVRAFSPNLIPFFFGKKPKQMNLGFGSTEPALHPY